MKANAPILTEIKQAYVESGGIYGSPRIHRDLKEAGFACSEIRVEKIMRDAQLKSVREYRKPRFTAGKPMIAAPNRLEQRFNVDQADTAWVTALT